MINTLFTEALNIQDPWFITSVNFNEEEKRLDLEVDFKRGATFIDNGEAEDIRKPYKAYDTVQRAINTLIFLNIAAICQ